MTCLSKRFSLTNDNLTMENDFTSKSGYLGKKESAENILNCNVLQSLKCNNETGEFLEMLALPKIKRHISTKIRSKDIVDY